jgi:hypothetical protein
MTVQHNPITGWYDYISATGSGAPPTVIPPLIPQYDPAWDYSTSNYVMSGDVIWQALQDSTGVLPGTDPLTWQQIIPGAPALVPPYLPVYDPAYAYDAGRYVVSGDKIWLSLVPTIGDIPGTNSLIWRQVLDIPVIPEWDLAYPYQAGQYVMFNDRVYISLVPSINVQPDSDPLSWMWVMEKPHLGEWSTDYEYVSGQWVVYSGILYRSLVNNNQGNQPDTSPTEWEVMLEDPVVEYQWADIITTVAGLHTYDILVGGVPTAPTVPLETYINLSGCELYYGTDFTIAGSTITLIPAGFNTNVDDGWLMRVIFK